MTLMDRKKLSKRSLEQLEAMPPEKRQKIEAILEQHQTPESRAKELAERAAIEREVIGTGGITTKEQGFIPVVVPTGVSLVAALKKAREEAGVSMMELSRRSGIDPAALSRIENGQQANITISTAVRYAAAIGKKLNWSIEG